MYPSLIPSGSSSRWHYNKPTQQELIEEIADIEEKLKEKSERALRIQAPVVFQGKVILPSKTTQSDKDQEGMQDDDDDDELMHQGQQLDTMDSDMYSSSYYLRGMEDGDQVGSNSPNFTLSS